MTRLNAVAALLLLALLSGGCASDAVYQQEGRPSAPPPWRVVVLPAIAASPGEGKEIPSIDVDVLEETRECLAMGIPRDGFRLVSLPRVDLTIPPSEGPVQDEAAVARAGRAFDADLVILPEVFSWTRKYYVVHSVARVGLRVKVYDGRSGALLLESDHEQVRNQGIQKIPVWTGGLIYGPIRGLLHEQMMYMCDNVADLIGKDLSSFTHSAPGGDKPEVPPAGDTPD
jgi:hypothetical protein